MNVRLLENETRRRKVSAGATDDEKKASTCRKAIRENEEKQTRHIMSSWT